MILSQACRVLQELSNGMSASKSYEELLSLAQFLHLRLVACQMAAILQSTLRYIRSQVSIQPDRTVGRKRSCSSWPPDKICLHAKSQSSTRYRIGKGIRKQLIIWNKGEILETKWDPEGEKVNRGNKIKS